MNINQLQPEELWAKSNPYKSLINHMIEVGETTKVLLSEGNFHALLILLQKQLGIDEERVVSFAAYISALHDIGKCHPLFQYNSQVPDVYEKIGSEKLEYPIKADDFRHEKYSYDIAIRIFKEKKRFDNRTANLICKIIKLHHQGKKGKDYKLDDELKSSKVWNRFQDDIEEELWIKFNPPKICIGKNNTDTICTSLLGVLILSDWIASGSPFISNNLKDINQNMICKEVNNFLKLSGMSKGLLPGCICFNDTWRNIPQGNLRPLQISIDQYFKNTNEAPLAMIIEAPMGEGKTEAGVYAALKMASYWGKYGFYIGLPTSATSNQMHGRMNDLLKQHDLGNVKLLHSMAWIMDETDDIERFYTEDEAYALQWTAPLKRGLLTNFAVGTIDQVMMSVLAIKYGVLRLSGLATKVLIIDEIHAYDAYMSDIIKLLLKWCKALKIPVVMLSATLPIYKKSEFVEVYSASKAKEEYPLITAMYDDGRTDFIRVKDTYKKQSVKLEMLRCLGDNKQIAEKARELVSCGGCLCIIMNTVKEAQALYIELMRKKGDEELYLFHARFTAQRREEIEKKCIQLFGSEKSKRPKKAILVATQVVEQSLDLDFDVMITAIAPIDLILQRMGRLHRHEYTLRPEALKEPNLVVLVPPEGFKYGVNEVVYYGAILEKTRVVLEKHQNVRIPEDISDMVEEVYRHVDINDQAFEKWMEYKFDDQIKKSQAIQYEIKEPQESSFSMSVRDNIFDDDETSSYLSAKTRLGEDTIKIALLPEILYKEVVESERITKTLAKKVLLYSLSVTKASLQGYLQKKMDNGDDPYVCKGLLYGLVLFIAKDNKCTFSDNTYIQMDDNLGIIIDKKEG